MNSNDIAYTAKVNAACWLIRKASKIARRLADTTSEQQQAIELEIVNIGMRLYSETREEQQPEATCHPGEDHELEDFVAAVRELVPDMKRSAIEQYHKNHRISPAEAVKRWKVWQQIQELKKP